MEDMQEVKGCVTIASRYALLLGPRILIVICAR